MTAAPRPRSDAARKGDKHVGTDKVTALSAALELIAATHVYVVEDDPDHALLIERALRQGGRPVEVAVFGDGEAALAALRGDLAPGLRPEPNGEAALAALREPGGTPDLILLDINLPGLSGLELLARIKGDARLRRIPVIMLTTSDSPADVARAYALGAGGYVTKSRLEPAEGATFELMLPGRNRSGAADGRTAPPRRLIRLTT